MTLITTKLKSGGLHEKHEACSDNLESWEPPQPVCIGIHVRMTMASSTMYINLLATEFYI
jgi:hypothetical protein